MLKVAVVVVFLALAACALGKHKGVHIGIRKNPFLIESAGSKIVGGDDATPGQFPHQVSIQLLNSNGTLHIHNCGGSILNEWWILTAAHCVVGPENYKDSFLIVAGEHDFKTEEGTEQRVFVERFVKHEDYPNVPVVDDNDIALIKLLTPLTLNTRVAAIALPVAGDIPAGGSSSTLSGWGSTHQLPPNQHPNILQNAVLPIVEYSVCEEIFVDSPINSTNVCTGPLTGGYSACSGDSGGPLIQREEGMADVVIGVVSWGVIPCGSVGWPSVYTRVSAFVDWINTNMV